MPEACAMNLLSLSDDNLRKVLTKASTRSLARLVVAYPRSVGRTFMTILTDSVSPVTLEFLRDEMNVTRLPTYPEIRQAESELMKIVHEENLDEAISSSELATAHQK